MVNMIGNDVEMTCNGTEIELVSAYRDEPELIEVAELFLADLEQVIPQLQEAYQGKNWPELTRLAHYLKGGAGSGGFMDYADICSQLQFATAQKALDVIGPLVDQVVRLADRLQAF